jgi:hypothetical protein
LNRQVVSWCYGFLGVVGMDRPSFSIKCQILGDYWSQYRGLLAANDVWSSFISENQRGFFLAFALSRKMAESPSQRGTDLINETYVKFCDLLWIDSAHPFKSLDDALSYSLDPPLPVKNSRRERPPKPNVRTSRQVSTSTSRQVTSGMGASLRGRTEDSRLDPGWPRVVGFAIAAVIVVVSAAMVIPNLSDGLRNVEIGVEQSNVKDPDFGVDVDRTIVVEPDPVRTYTPSDDGRRESSQPTPEETPKRINFDFSQGTTSNSQDDRPVSGPGSGCKIGVAKGDRCVGVRPVRGPRGPVPQPFSLPRESVPPPPLNQPKIDSEAPGSDDALEIGLEDSSE